MLHGARCGPLLAVLVVVSGCGRGGGSGGGLALALSTAGNAALSVLAGDAQSAPSHTTLPVPLIVQLEDPTKGLLANVPVTFTVVSGGGTISTPTVVTDAQGRARASLVLGSMGANVIMAQASGAAGPVRFNETALYNGAPLEGSTNPLDAAALVVLKRNNVEPAALSTDEEFLRRVTGDLVGRLPTPAERAAFVGSAAVDKRATKFDQLLATDEFATHWAADVIAPWLTVPSVFFDENGNPFPFDQSFADYLRNDAPIAQVVQDLATRTGTAGATFDMSFAGIYSETTAVDKLVGAFTGMTSRCARCHDHPLTGATDDPKWTQDDNYALYAFVAETPDPATKVDKAGVKFGTPLQPGWVLDGYANAPKGLPKLTDPVDVRRAAFGQLLAASPAFRRGTSHRIGTEIAAPLLNPDQFLRANIDAVASPELLAALTQTFTNEGTSLKGFLRVCLNSKLYQLSSSGTSTAADALQGRYVLRRNHAEVIERGDWGIAGITTGTQWTSYTLQASTTPLTLPVTDIFALNFGYPIRFTTVNNPMRIDAVSMQQELIQLNTANGTSGLVALPASQLGALAAAVDAQKLTFASAVAVLFRSALSREPTPAEINLIQTATAGSASTRAALEDAAVGITGSAEFVFRH